MDDSPRTANAQQTGVYLRAIDIQWMNVIPRVVIDNGRIIIRELLVRDGRILIR